MKHVRRKGGADSFDVKNPNKRIYVCEFHFKDEDLTTTLGRGKRKVKAGRVPSIFREQPVKQKATRPPPKNRPASFVESETESDQVLSSSSPSSEKEPSESYVEEASETERLIEEIKQLRTKNECLQKKNNMLLEENKLLKLQRFSFENLCENKEQFRSATGLNPDCFMSLFNYLKNPGDDCRNIKFYDTSKRLSEQKYTNSEEVKSGPKPKLSAKEQLFMYLSWLKNAFALSHVSFLFQSPKATVSRDIINWTNFLYFSLGSIPIWPNVSKSTKKCQKYLREHTTPLLDAY